MSCLKTFADRYAPLLNDARLDVEEFLATGFVGRAKTLSAATGQRFDDARLPQFFTGDLDAKVVLIHLNPKSGPTPKWHSSVSSFDDWFSWFRHFGERMYGPDSPRTHRSPFDHKQVRFLKPLGHIDFVPEGKPKDRFTNLQRVVDNKLQMELVPYASNSFATRGFTPQVLRPHLGASSRQSLKCRASMCCSADKSLNPSWGSMSTAGIASRSGRRMAR